MNQQQSISTSLYASQELVLYSVVEEWLRELSTYRKDALLYHEDHPRIRGHVEAVQELFEAFLNRFGSLEISVRPDGLWIDNVAIGAGAASVQTLASILRERSVVRLRIEPNLTQLEVRVLLNVLLAPPATAMHAIEVEQDDWEHLKFTIDRTVSAAVEAPSHQDQDLVTLSNAPTSAKAPTATQATKGAAHDATGGDLTSAHIPGLPADLCDRIPANCARHLHNLLQSPEAQARMTELDQYFHATTTQKRFLARFLEILLENPTVRWDDRDELRDSLFGGFDLLLEAANKYSTIGTLPTQLLIPRAGASDEVSTHFRWSLLQGFFPEAISSQSPREAEDLSFYFRKSGGPLSEPSEIPWSPNRPTDVHRAFELQFEQHALLVEYADVAREMLLGTIDGRDHAQLLVDTSRTLKEQTKSASHVEPLLSPLLDRWRQLPMPDQGALLAEVVRGAHPDECLDIVSGGDVAVRETLLRVPPLPLDKSVAAEWENYQRPRELLRQVLVRRDDFALDVCARTLLGKNRDAAMRGGWLDVFECLATKNPRFLTWMNRNAKALCHPASIPLLFRVPFEELRLELMRFLSHQGDEQLQQFYIALGRFNSVTATRMLILGLEFESPPVRKAVIHALGNQHDPRALQVLENLLEEHNLGIAQNEAEVDVICDSIIRFDAHESQVLVQRVLTERQGLRKKWKRSIRHAIRESSHTLDSPEAK